MVLLEAMCLGIAPATPPVAGLLELVSDGCEELFSDCRHGGKLAAQVGFFADDKGCVFSCVPLRVQAPCARPQLMFAQAS